ncbi:hypothetical protein KW782_03415 [Candidatus Parcubacteria bacterium]|nr:hypothetical protein [Candidatus Parcubacteria bacterium]
MDLSRKTWVNHIIIAGGIIVAGCIVFGYIKTMRRLTDPALLQGTEVCRTCITLDHNLGKRVVKSGTEVVLELPQSLYPVNELVVITYPADIVELSTVVPKIEGNWARKIELLEPGSAEIIVRSSNSNISDFYHALTIE